MTAVHTESPTLTQFFEAWPLFADAVWAGTLMGCTLGLLGTYVIVRHLVFLSAALSQAASLGVALSFYCAAAFGLSAALSSPTLWALLATVVVVIGFARPRGAHTASDDEMLGVIYLVGIAGTLAVGTRIVEDLADIQTLLFGTAVAVLPEDLATIEWVCASILALHVVLWRGFVAVSTDPIGATIRGLPTRGLDLLLFTTLAAAISVCTEVLGALPAFAFSVLPALAALRFAASVRQALLIAAGFGAVTGFGGYLLAFLLELPVGASQAIVGVFVLAVSSLLGAIIHPSLPQITTSPSPQPQPEPRSPQ